MNTHKAEPLPLNIKIESNNEIPISKATTLLDKFLHNGVAIHAANNTVSAQLHQLYQGLKDEKKRNRHTEVTGSD
ncbi:unnamed protein product [Cunninghamella blakesleeana]